MGKPTGFMEYERQAMPSRDPAVRINDFYEVYGRADEHQLKEQGARCMDCGVAFCQSHTGCPIDNLIPEWNDLIYHGRWQDAYHRLSATNNFPEFTGRICPAPCESACVLGIIEPAVTIKSIECAIIDRAFEEGWVLPTTPQTRTGKKVAIIGSGPAGLAAADQLNKAGHHVTVFERDDRIGGLLMYGVPNMKLDKQIVQRRVDLLADSGVTFQTNANVGVNVEADQIQRDFDAVLLACGALQGRDLNLPGRDLAGVHLAMEYLTTATVALLDDRKPDHRFIDAKDKHVIVIGGGDTGTDCIGTAIRHGCTSITNITRRQREPEYRDDEHPWPQDPGTYYLDYAHVEGVAKYGHDPRRYGILPLEFVGDEHGQVKAMRVEHLQWKKTDGQWVSHRTGHVEDLPADLILLSIGFTGHDTPAMIEQFGVNIDRGTVTSDYGDYTTNVEGLFAAGDMRRGASLVVWAIAEGRGAAHRIDQYLMGHSELPAPGVATHLASSAG